VISPDGVVPSRMVGVSASVNLPLHHKVQKFSYSTGSTGWSRKKGHKTVVVCGMIIFNCIFCNQSSLKNDTSTIKQDNDNIWVKTNITARSKK